jgi:ATP phosphoribosyltransferase regulatory subunit
VVNSRLSAEDLVARFARRGYLRVEPPVLQPADIFLDQSGENFRRRMFITTDAEGRELALRPEFTIPVVRLYLAQESHGQEARYSYCGRVFRMQSGSPGEFVQAGIESFGRIDLTAADAEIMGLALEGLRAFGIDEPVIQMGDMGLFSALLNALDVPAPVLRRLKRAFAKGQLNAGTLDQVLDDRGREDATLTGLSSALSGIDPVTARQLVEDLLKIAGISTVGGRSNAEIADRLLEQAEQGQSVVPERTRALLSDYLSISGDPDTASSALHALMQREQIALEEAIARFDERNGFLHLSGIELDRIRFSTAFGRDLDYYTGLVFEMRAAHQPESGPLVGGGRYDRLAHSLGASVPVPAVGCSVFMDRLLGVAA